MTSDLVVVHWTEKIETAFAILGVKQIRHLPVVDAEGAIVGIISDRDFYRAMQIDQPDFESGRIAQPEFDPNARVRDFMSWPVQAIDEKRSVAEAARLMIDRGISSLIVTSGDQVVGIVTTEDMLRALLVRSESLLDQIKAGVASTVYNATVGQVANALSNAGI